MLLVLYSKVALALPINSLGATSGVSKYFSLFHSRWEASFGLVLSIRLDDNQGTGNFFSHL